MQNLIINENSIKDKIHTIRNFQVMLDKDFSQRVQAQEQNFMELKQKG